MTTAGLRPDTERPSSYDGAVDLIERRGPEALAARWQYRRGQVKISSVELSISWLAVRLTATSLNVTRR
jgi:hypothetical protein